jgi:peptidoglycan-N-acetylglucosamine deacetylase
MMRKPQVLALFVALAALALGMSAALNLALASAGLAWLGWSVDAAVLGLVILTSVGCFGPNVPIFGPVIRGHRIDARVMALTFDDGPSPDTTPRILDALRDASARATFFVLGKHAEHHPEVIERMVREGHEIANHGWTHGLLVFASPSGIRRELDNTARLLASYGAPHPTLFRAPHGFRGPLLGRVVEKLGYRVVGWSKGVFDTALPGSEVIAERSRQGMYPGAILLLHDADGNGSGDRSQTADALPKILRDMREQGLTPVTVSELAAFEATRSRPWRRNMFIVAVAGAVVGLLIYRAGPGSIGTSLKIFARLNMAFVAAAVVANLVSIALKATVWQACLDSVPSRPLVRYRHVVAALFVGFLMNSVLVARMGELGRAIVLRRRIAIDTGVRVPLGTIAGTVVSENLVLGATLTLLLVTMALTVSNLPAGVRNGVTVMVVSVAVLLLLVVAGQGLSYWRRRRSTGGPAPQAGFHWRWITHRAGRFVHELGEGQRLFSHPPRAALATSAGLVSWMANLVAIWFTVLAFGIHAHAFAAAVVVFAVSNLVGVVQVTPGNVGVFQVAIALALEQSYGVDRTLAVNFGIGLQAIEIGLGAGLGLFFLSLEGLSLGKVRKDIADEVGRSEGDPVGSS